MVAKRAAAADILAMTTRRDSAPNFGDYSKRLAYRLRDLRLERGLSQESIAHRANIALYTYQKYEKGESRPGHPLNPTYHTLVSLAWAYDMSIAELLDLDGSRRRRRRG